MMIGKCASSFLVPVFFISFCSLSMALPTYTPGVWKNITPSGVQTGSPNTCIGQGIAFDPSNRSTIYWCNGPYNTDGVYKSTNGGESWAELGAGYTDPNPWDGTTQHLNNPLPIRVDPNNGQHLYCGVGVRGYNGFWVSTDGGLNWTKPQAFSDAVQATGGASAGDVYDIAVDPTDFSHALVSFHYSWAGDQSSGVLETFDGGASWTTHLALASWGSGHSIKFLYNPKLGIGNSNTWLLMTQGNGFWRTTNSGTNWTQVSTVNITHGGGTVYYTANGTIYASGMEASQRSTNNGVSWTSIGINSTWCIGGDGTTLYSGKSFGGNQNILISPESNGTTWTNFNTQVISDGPYNMAFDEVNGIMYSSNWSSGVWALKVAGYTPTKLENPAQLMKNAQSIGNRSFTILGNRFMIPENLRNAAKSMQLYSLQGKNIGHAAIQSNGEILIDRNKAGNQPILARIE